ncbi:hypothetical protein [Streptococcus phage TP-J34]|uniref:Major capsid protein n=1 Tax=Streptococcus phage TP-J34 TaxID=73422 RepID=L0P3N2_9CAUD|nr:major head protein [Streptococcus phage TP-J34]CCI71966.1 hypothetical protein [Streptococcus phage TP-J34]
MPTTTIFDTANIVRSCPNKAVSAIVDSSYPGVLVDGKKYIKAGTLVAGNGGSIFDDRTKAVVENKTEPEGIVLYDVDLTIDNTVSVLYAGEVYKDKVNGGDVTDTVKKALPLVKFISEK